MNDIATPEPALVRYEAMCRAIAECARVDEAKDISDKAAALEAYYRQAKNHEAERELATVRLRAERRVGELLKELPRTPPAEAGAQGGRGNEKSLSDDATGFAPSPFAQALADTGISRQQASRLQAIADVPTKTFEAALTSEKPTMAVKQATKSKGVPAPARPRPSPVLDKAREIVREPVAKGEAISKRDLQAEHGISHVIFDTAIAAERAAQEERDKLAADMVALDAKLVETPLSATAQRKLEAYERRVETRLTAEFRSQFDQEVRQEVDRIIALRSKYDAELIAQLYEWDRGRTRYTFTNEEFRLILSALHPDANDPARRQEAFNTFKLKELLLRKPEAKLKVNPLAGLKEKIEARRAGRR
jgi:hypothetical protein